jgi:hypothetical protein
MAKENIVDLIEAQTKATIKATSFQDFMTGVHNAMNHGEVFGEHFDNDEALDKIFKHVEALIKVAKKNDL